MAELKSELERKNLEFAQQIDALRLIAENNDELSIELETTKDDLEHMEKELQALRVAIWKMNYSHLQQCPCLEPVSYTEMSFLL